MDEHTKSKDWYDRELMKSAFHQHLLYDGFILLVGGLSLVLNDFNVFFLLAVVSVLVSIHVSIHSIHDIITYGVYPTRLIRVIWISNIVSAILLVCGFIWR